MGCGQNASDVYVRHIHLHIPHHTNRNTLPSILEPTSKTQ